MLNRKVLSIGLLITLVLIVTGCGIGKTTTVPYYSTVTQTITQTTTASSSFSDLPQLPTISENIVMVWNSAPSPSQGIPPIISKQITLQPYGEPGSTAVVEDLYTQSRYWVDIIVKSLNTKVNFNDDAAGGVGIFHWNESFEFWQLPTLGYKFLFGYPGYDATETDEGTLYTTGIRLFAEYYPGFYFNNYNPNDSVTLTYEVYNLEYYTPEYSRLIDDFETWSLSPQIQQLLKQDFNQAVLMIDEWLEPFGLEWFLTLPVREK